MWVLQSCAVDVIWSQSRSSDRAAEPWYQVPAHIPSHPIAANHDIFSHFYCITELIKTKILRKINT